MRTWIVFASDTDIPRFIGQCSAHKASLSFRKQPSRDNGKIHPREKGFDECSGISRNKWAGEVEKEQWSQRLANKGEEQRRVEFYCREWICSTGGPSLAILYSILWGRILHSIGFQENISLIVVRLLFMLKKNFCFTQRTYCSRIPYPLHFLRTQAL